VTNTSDLRALIDLAKEEAAARDAEPISISLGAVDIPVKRSRPRGERETDPIDPSNVAVIGPHNAYVPALVARLIAIRSEKRALSAEEDAIKEVLVGTVGELEYLAFEEDEKPILSLRHTEQLRVNTEWVREHFPPGETSDAWKKSTMRPLRILEA
jgi:hypothetical protein